MWGRAVVLRIFGTRMRRALGPASAGSGVDRGSVAAEALATTLRGSTWYIDRPITTLSGCLGVIRDHRID
jgi:hypothetical protein